MAATAEQKKKPVNETLESALIMQAHGRCQCEGLCGHNHFWLPEGAPVRCTAVHGVNIVRKKGHASCVWNAPLQGFTQHMDKELGLPGPRTHFPKRYVTEGNVVEFAHPEHFEMDKISQVWLKAVRVAPGRRDEAFRVFCQFCAHYAEQRGVLL